MCLRQIVVNHRRLPLADTNHSTFAYEGEATRGNIEWSIFALEAGIPGGTGHLISDGFR